MTAGLTPRQAQLLTFIEVFTSEAGFAPTTEQMRVALGLGSKSGICRLLDALQQRGQIRRLHHAARSVEVIRTNPYGQYAIANLSSERLCALSDLVEAEVARRWKKPASDRPERQGRAP